MSSKICFILLQILTDMFLLTFIKNIFLNSWQDDPVVGYFNDSARINKTRSWYETD
jgi:hypothetical protein